GVGKAHLNLLVETTPPAGQLARDVEVLVSFPGRGALRYRFVPAQGPRSLERAEGSGPPGSGSLAVAAADQVVEMAIPLSELTDLGEAGGVQFQVLLVQGHEELERHPEGLWISVGVEEGPHEP